MDARSRMIDSTFSRLIIALVFVATPIALANTSPAQLSESDVRTANDALSLTVSASHATICRGGSLAVDAELSNYGKAEVAIDSTGIKYQISIEKFRVQDGGASNSSLSKRGDYGPDQKDEANYTVLAPGRRFRTRIHFPVREKFFNDFGKYRITFTYGQFRKDSFKDVPLFTGTVMSNTLEFQIVRCKLRR